MISVETERETALPTIMTTIKVIAKFFSSKEIGYGRFGVSSNIEK